MLQTQKSTSWRFVLQTVRHNFLLLDSPKCGKTPWLQRLRIFPLIFIRQILGVGLAENLVSFGFPTPFFRYSTGFYTRGLSENSLKPIMAGVKLLEE